MNRYLWQNKPWQAFKNFAIIFSFIANIVLLIVLLLVSPLLLPIVNEIAGPLVGGLTESFVEMGEASIVETIVVDDTMPINFVLPLNQKTQVVLSDPVPLNVPASFILPDGGGTINGRVVLSLPAGQILPIELSLDVPVSQTIPVKLNVPVDIELARTDLGTPFNRLQALFTPLDRLLSGLPSSGEELEARLVTQEK